MYNLNPLFILKMLGGDGKAVIGSCGASKSFGLCEHQLLLQLSTVHNYVTATDTKLCI